MGPDPVLGPVVDGAQVQVDALDGAEVAFDAGQTLVGGHHLARVHLLGAVGGADDIQPVQGRLGGDLVLVAGEGERVFGVGVGPGRPASLSAGGFPWPALRTGHATSTASGSPRVHAAGTGDPSTIGAASSASRVPGTRPLRGRATDRRYSPANSSICFVAANTLDPFAM